MSNKINKRKVTLNAYNNEVKDNGGLGFFERYLTIWVAICIVAGVLIGVYIPQIPETLDKFTYAQVSIPVSILIWLMIYPMMLKIDFTSIKNATKQKKGLTVTCVTNWLIKPFSMYAISYFFLFIVFKNIIPFDLAKEYLAGTVLLGAAPCTAMVFVWSHLTKGNAAYTLVQVAVNDLILLVGFVPIVVLLLGVTDVIVPMDTLFLSVVFVWQPRQLYFRPLWAIAYYRLRSWVMKPFIYYGKCCYCLF